MALENRKRLGRGLDALLGSYPDATEQPAPEPAATGRRNVSIALIHRNPRNPRREFRPEELDDLAASLKQHGIVQPIVVRPAPDDPQGYEIIAGERRWRAAQMAGLHEVPVTVMDVSDKQALELAIVENVQRSDLNPIEEARGYQALIEEFGYSQGDLGTTIGKSRVHVTNTLRLLRLPQSVLGLLEAGSLSAGHGRALLGAAEPERLARQIVDKNLSVREAERLAQPVDKMRRPRPPRAIVKNADVSSLEKELSDLLGLKVELRHGVDGYGELRLMYSTIDQLDLVCRKLRR